ncbi:carboxyl transferase domain-containing protein [Streptomyces sp. Tu 2975]|uniref:carboxyl transferase domain-containing protein n=1 Tax=Streptomyces sp. Tu 2975 TaxID=2676871 RepID=UPI00244C8BA9|nr:carboxyl transferase domain-containing protein [Streptomyces sp. Tu 2975]
MGRNIICALARLDGRWSASSRTSAVAGRGAGHRGVREGARFVQMCDAFNIRSSRCWTCRFLPGVDQEHAHHPPRRETAVRVLQRDRPRISLILRKAYGGAYIVMDSQSIGADLTYAWPPTRSR